MGIKRESEMIAVKVEEREIRRGARREKAEAKNKRGKKEGRGRMSFFLNPPSVSAPVLEERSLF